MVDLEAEVDGQNEQKIFGMRYETMKITLGENNQKRKYVCLLADICCKYVSPHHPPAFILSVPPRTLNV